MLLVISMQKNEKAKKIMAGRMILRSFMQRVCFMSFIYLFIYFFWGNIVVFWILNRGIELRIIKQQGIWGKISSNHANTKNEIK